MSLAAAMTMGPVVIMGPYLLIARRLAFDAQIIRHRPGASWGLKPAIWNIACISDVDHFSSTYSR